MLVLCLPNTFRDKMDQLKKWSHIFLIFSFRIMTTPEQMAELQFQLRNNNEELSDVMRGLGDWLKDMNAKDDQLRQKNIEKVKTMDEPLRSVNELKLNPHLELGTKTDPPPEEAKEPEKKVVKKKKSIGFSEPPPAPKAVSVNDAKVLQEAVAEKDRGNELFKVRSGEMLLKILRSIMFVSIFRKENTRKP